jgi:hypothetical protein
MPPESAPNSFGGLPLWWSDTGAYCYGLSGSLGEIYTEKAADAVSYYRPHLQTSIQFLESLGPATAASTIDVGARESTLIDDLLERRYQNITVLDISETAVAAIACDLDWCGRDSDGAKLCHAT